MSDLNTVTINDVQYPALGITHKLVSQWPQKLIVGGDVTKDSHPYLSTWSDFHHGIAGLGVYKFRVGDDHDRYWTSSAETRYTGQLGRPPKVTSSTPSAGGSGIATNTGAYSPGTVVDEQDAGVKWSSEANAMTSNNQYARCADDGAATTGSYLTCTNFGFAIPNSATINGVVVSMERKVSEASEIDIPDLQLVKAGARAGDDKGSASQISDTSDATQTYGGAADLWSLTLNPVDVNASDFGVSFRVHFEGDSDLQTLYVDHVTITVYYTPSAIGDKITQGIVHNYDGVQQVYVFTTSNEVKVDDTAGGTGTWTSSIRTLAANAVSLAQYIPTTGADAGKVMLYVAQTSDIDRTEAGTSWSRDTTNAIRLVVWDERLWLIDAVGALKSTSDGTTWAADSVLTNIDGTVRFITDMFIGKKTDGTTAIYVTTNDGLFRHNAANTVFEGPLIEWPRHTLAGRGSSEVSAETDSLMIPIGLDMLQYIPGEPAVVQSVGLGRDDGLPSEYDGSITKVIRLFHGMAAVTSQSSSSARPALWFWDSAATRWHLIAQPVSTGTYTSTHPLSTAWLSNAYSEYRLYFTAQSDDRVFYIRLYPGVHNPRVNPTQSFEVSSTSEHETYWFAGARDTLPKIALSVTIRASDTGTSDYFQIGYRTDLNELITTTLTNSTFSDGKIDTDGKYTFEFDADHDGNNEGVAFDNIKFVITWGNPVGASASANPTLEYMEFNFLQHLPPVWAHTVILDLSQPFRGRSPQQMFATLKDLADPSQVSALVEMTWAPTTDGTVMVRLFEFEAQSQEIGTDPRGIYIATFLEPIV